MAQNRRRRTRIELSDVHGLGGQALGGMARDACSGGAAEGRSPREQLEHRHAPGACWSSSNAWTPQE